MGARTTEPLELKVTDIHHDASYTTINISDAKRQDDYGKPVVRKVPVFPEMESYLLDGLETLNEGSVWLFPSLRNHGRSIDKPFKDIIKKAGHEPWPAICNNIRATRANEIERTYRGTLESAWVGHDPKTYRKHYSQVQEADLVRACTTGANMVQHGGVHSGTVVLATKEHHEQIHLQEVARLFRSVQMASVPPLGLERSPSSSGTSNKPVATVANTLQLAAIISAMDRNELEQRLLDLLKEIQPDTSE